METIDSGGLIEFVRKGIICKRISDFDRIFFRMHLFWTCNIKK